MPAMDCWNISITMQIRFALKIFSAKRFVFVIPPWFCDVAIKSSFKTRIIIVVYAVHDNHVNRLVSFVYCPVFDFLFSELLRSISCRLTVSFDDIFVRGIICVSRDINFMFNLKYNLALCHFWHGTFVNQKSLVWDEYKGVAASHATLEKRLTF